MTRQPPRWHFARPAAAACIVALSACGGSVQFADATSIDITATPPPPPPPPPPEPEPEPKRVTITADAIQISDKILFEVDKATIVSSSYDLLDEIVSVLQDNPQIKLVSIEGHTDSDGSDTHNLKLSDARAKSVMAYLTEHGVTAGRLTAKGFGESKPIADNATDEGKEKNRRVEFLIKEQEKVTKTYIVDPETGEKKEVAETTEQGQ